MRNNRFEVFSPTLLQLIKTVQNIKSRKLAEYDLKGTNALCLFEILDSGEQGLSATELARRCDIDKAQVSRCMKELADKNMIFRDNADGRKYKQKYHLTEAGSVAAKDLYDTSLRVKNAVKKNLTAQDTDEFYRIMNVICDNLDDLLKLEI
ncbi:MAG: MarR family transcriptional regulator [Clostridia bacterium]|nr:MarR family transcriptional regulator [Clostridia bacterium]